VLGAGRPELRPLLAGAIGRLGTRRTFVVLGEDGLGDVTLAGETYVTEVCDGKTREFTWQPETFGIQPAPLASLNVNGPAASAAIIRQILEGEPGPARDIVVLNAAAGLIAAGRSSEPRAAAAAAQQAIDNGTAKSLLDRLIARSAQAA
jgi:anthranilate phosphoribosyltransferase